VTASPQGTDLASMTAVRAIATGSTVRPARHSGLVKRPLADAVTVERGMIVRARPAREEIANIGASVRCAGCTTAKRRCA